MCHRIQAARGYLLLVLLCAVLGCSDPEEDPRAALLRQEFSEHEAQRLVQQAKRQHELLELQAQPIGGRLYVELDLAGTDVTDEQLKAIELPDSLTRLDLARTRITDACLEHVKTATGIQELNLSETRTTTAGLVHLREMPNLRSVNLHNTDIPLSEQRDFLTYLRGRRPKGPGNAR